MQVLQKKGKVTSTLGSVFMTLPRALGNGHHSCHFIGRFNAKKVSQFLIS